MRTALNAWTLSDLSTVDEQLAATATAGFDGIELTADYGAALTPETPVAAFAEARNRAGDAGLSIVGLATRAWLETNFASPEPATRTVARDLALRLLERATACEAGAILVIPAMVGRFDEPQPRVRYAEALNHVYEALLSLRAEAESCGVTLAIENLWNRFLLSPVEAADLLDRINSPNVGWYFDVGNIMPFGYPADWLRTLGRRVSRVHLKDYDLSRPGPAGFCPLGEGSVDWQEVFAALDDIGYDGPVTYEGRGTPDDIRRRMAAIVPSRAGAAPS